MGFKTFRHVNRKTGGGFGAAIFALLLSIGVYLFPLGQDIIWAKLYELADGNVWKAWLYLYLLSLGLITLGYWGLSAKRAKITYSARKYGILFLAIALVAAAAVAPAHATGSAQMVYPAELAPGSEYDLYVQDGDVIPFVIQNAVETYIFGWDGGWVPYDAFDNTKFFIAFGENAFKFEKMEIKVDTGDYWIFNVHFADWLPVSASISPSGAGPGLTATTTGTTTWLDGQIYGSSPYGTTGTVAGDGLHLVSTSDSRGKSTYVDSDYYFVDSSGVVDLVVNSPQEGATVQTPFTVNVSVDWQPSFPVTELRFGYDSYQVDNPVTVVDVDLPGDYEAQLAPAPGAHTVHVYAVDYDIIQPIGAGDYHPPPGYQFRIIRAEQHVHVQVSEGNPEYDVTITAPEDGSNHPAGSAISITWTADPTPDGYQIAIYAPTAGPEWQDVGTSTSYSWTPEAAGDFIIAVKALYGDDYATDSVQIHVYEEATCTVNSPVSGETYTNAIPIDVSVPDGVVRVDAWISGVTDRLSLSVSNHEAVGSLQAPAGGPYTVSFEAFDGSGVSVWTGSVSDVSVVVQEDTAPYPEFTNIDDGSVVGTTFTVEWTYTAGTPTSQYLIVNYTTSEERIDLSADARNATITSDISAGWVRVELHASNDYGSNSIAATIYVYGGTPNPRILSPSDGEDVGDFVVVIFDWGIPPSERDHAEYMFDWYSAWHTTNETMLTSVAEGVPTDGAHTFSLRVYDTAGHQGAATVTFT
ncbi:MAG: hypothetical protein DRP85_08670, partial [Candidatus Makaraimicrobium thalassicum]